MKLSVIIPVYRVEDTLDRCVESVLSQHVDDMEVILVDDGSPDQCPTICDRWAQKDARIRVIHKANGIGDDQNHPSRYRQDLTHHNRYSLQHYF